MNSTTGQALHIRAFNSSRFKNTPSTVDGEKIKKYVNELTPYYISVFDKYFGPNFNQTAKIVDSFPWNAFVDFGLGKSDIDVTSEE